MGNPDGFMIVCYLAWCGAGATYRFSNQSQYNEARAFLDGITNVQFHGDELPPNYSKTMRGYYTIEKKDREAFKNFMQQA